MKLTLEEILRACEGELVKGVKDETAYTFSTDTRSIKHGDIYIPLKGAKFDGENFIDNAIEKGASGCFTTKDNVEAPLVIKVPDTLKAYLELCRFYKDKQKTFTIGITGSSGKTTTKEMLYSVLSENFRTHKTFSNHNNEIGFCETINTMPEDTDIVIIEMGMRGLGEIELIAKHAKPDIGIITNTGSAHIGRLGSLDNIAKAKCELTKFINPKGALIEKYTAFINLNPKYYVAYRDRAVLYTHVGKYREAIADNQLLIMHNERVWSDAVINKAEALFFLKDYVEALSVANHYFTICDEPTAECYRIRAEIFRKLKMRDEYKMDMRAYKHLRKAKK